MATTLTFETPGNYIRLNTPKMQPLIELIDIGILTIQQQFVLCLIVNYGATREKIMSYWKQVFHETLSADALGTCINRTCLSIIWEKGMSGGNNYYLNDQDTETLCVDVREKARMDRAYDTTSILEEAYRLKLLRIDKAIKALEILKAWKYAEKLQKTTIEKPTRQWVNSLLERINAKLVYPIFLESKRYFACKAEVIESFFINFATLLEETPRELLFVADETMVQLTKGNKVVIPLETAYYFEKATDEMPHITALCVNNIVGNKPPLFFVLKGLKNLPPELELLVRTQRIWLASTSNGWMNRPCFLMFALNFIGWLCEFRKGLDASIANKPAVLILDGHTSRENPLAMELFALYNIRVLVLPAHCTHILQLFDVSLALPLKKAFTTLFQDKLKLREYMIPGNIAATLRKIAVESFVEAWDITCTLSKAMQAAAAVGINPYHVNAPHVVASPRNPLQNKWVKETLPEEHERIIAARMQAASNRLNINNREITDPQVIEEIRESLTRTTYSIVKKPLNTFESFNELVGMIFHSDDKTFMLGTSQEFFGYKLRDFL